MSNSELLSPRQVAKAMGVSESSLKRWCDKGALQIQRTQGGHRKLHVSEVIRFARDHGQAFINPELLGLPANRGSSCTSIPSAIEKLYEAATTGCEISCRRVFYDLYLAGHRPAVLFDDLLQPVFERIGCQWEAGTVDVFEERLACSTIVRLFAEFRDSWVKNTLTGPVAIGGSTHGDHYQVASQAAEIVLRQLGWNATHLGTNLPLATWHKAIDQFRPRLLWLSLSFLQDEEDFVNQFPALYEHATSRGCSVALGGRAITSALKSRIPFSTCCERMKDLEAFAIAIHPPTLTAANL